MVCASWKKRCLLQRTSAGATTAEMDPNSLQGRTMPQPWLELQKDLGSEVQPAVLTGDLCSLWSRAKLDTKKDLDYVRETHFICVK